MKAAHCPLINSRATNNRAPRVRAHRHCVISTASVSCRHLCFPPRFGNAIFRDPADGLLADHRRLSRRRHSHQAGGGRSSGGARSEPTNLTSLGSRASSPPISARRTSPTHLGAPWIPASDVIAVVTKIVGTEIKMHHMPELGSWTVEARQLLSHPKKSGFFVVLGDLAQQVEQCDLFCRIELFHGQLGDEVGLGVHAVQDGLPGRQQGHDHLSTVLLVLG